MQAVFEGSVIAETDDADVVIIEGNIYFPPTAVTEGVLQASPTPCTSSEMGECQYYSARVHEQLHADLGWAYPRPYPTAIDRVGVDFSGYVAFDPRVTVTPSDFSPEGATP